MVYALGAVVERHQMCDMHEVYSRCSCSVPIVLLLLADQPAELGSVTGLQC